MRHGYNTFLLLTVRVLMPEIRFKLSGAICDLTEFSKEAA